MKTKDKIVLTLIIILTIALSFKSIVMDPIKINDSETEKMVVIVSEYMDSEHDNVLFKLGILKSRIIEVKITEDQVVRGHYRTYFIGLFPIGDSYPDIE